MGNGKYWRENHKSNGYPDSARLPPVKTVIYSGDFGDNLQDIPGRSRKRRIVKELFPITAQDASELEQGLTEIPLPKINLLPAEYQEESA